MPTIRIGFSSDFVLNNNRVGLGTTVAADGNLDVDGAIKGNFSVTGVATLASYGGFVAQKQQVNKPSTIEFATVGVGTFEQYYETETGFTDLGGVHHGDDQYFNTLSEDLVIDDGQILNITNTDMVGVTTIGEYDPHNHSSYVCAGSLEQVSVTDHFSVPNGGINDRQETPIEGTVRFNTDLNTLEFFNGNEWRQFTYNQGQSSRAVISSGYGPAPAFTYPAQYDYITISTLGNSAYFGDMQSSLREKMGCGSAIRALFGGGASPTPSNEIDYLTIASAGNGVDFGNLTSTNIHNSALSSSTRGIWGGGYSGSPAAFTNVIEYVEINTLGNALDFGDLSNDMDGGTAYHASFASPTRGVFACGTHPSSPAGDNVIRTAESITIASKGNSTRFGELTAKHQRSSAASNAIRGLIFSGRDDVPDISAIDMSSGGAAVHFGDLATADYSGFSACNAIRAVHGGGESSGRTNRIEYVTITTGGNAQDFGDMSHGTSFLGSTTDSHGGLGGF